MLALGSMLLVALGALALAAAIVLLTSTRESTAPSSPGPTPRA